MKYDALVSELEKEGVEVIEHKFYNSALKGLYFDNVIAINCKGIATEKEKTCILAEEYGPVLSSLTREITQMLHRCNI